MRTETVVLIDLVFVGDTDGFSYRWTGEAQVSPHTWAVSNAHGCFKWDGQSRNVHTGHRIFWRDNS